MFVKPQAKPVGQPKKGQAQKPKDPEVLVLRRTSPPLTEAHFPPLTWNPRVIGPPKKGDGNPNNTMRK